MTEVFTGRPESPEGRLPRELRAYDALDALGIPYARCDHPAAFTMEACAVPEEALGVPVCKNLFLCNRQQTAFYLLLLPGDLPFRTKELSAQIGSSRLSFAPPEAMLSLLDIEPGSMSILGLANDKEGRVRLLVEERLLAQPFWGVHPCVNTSTLRVASADLLRKFAPATGHDVTFVRLGYSEE